MHAYFPDESKLTAINEAGQFIGGIECLSYLTVATNQTRFAECNRRNVKLPSDSIQDTTTTHQISCFRGKRDAEVFISAGIYLHHLSLSSATTAHAQLWSTSCENVSSYFKACGAFGRESNRVDPK